MSTLHFHCHQRQFSCRQMNALQSRGLYTRRQMLHVMWLRYAVKVWLFLMISVASMKNLIKQFSQCIGRRFRRLLIGKRDVREDETLAARATLVLTWYVKLLKPATHGPSMTHILFNDASYCIIWRHILSYEFPSRHCDWTRANCVHQSSIVSFVHNDEPNHDEQETVVICSPFNLKKLSEDRRGF